MNNKKIETVKYWLQFTNVKKIRRFFKFINFYRRFIKRFKRLIIPFIKLMKNDKAFEWIQKQQDIFNQIKYKITNKLILVIIDSNKFFKVETNMFNFV